MAHAEAVLDDWAGTLEFVKYESQLNIVLREYDDLVICAYDLNLISANVLRTHPFTIVGGIVRENPFFSKPEDFLEELEQRN